MDAFSIGRESHVVINSLTPGDQEDGNGVIVIAHVTMVDGRNVSGGRQLLALGRHSRRADA